MEEIYVFGHKSPDTDTICSAIAYAKIKNLTPTRLGELNEETKFVLEKFGVEVPRPIENVEGKKVVLVDHNEFQQSADGIEKAEIVEVIDHHKIKFSCDKPVKFLTEPLGSTATLIAKYFESNIEKIEVNEKKKIKGLLLSAILSDTVVFKSPTTTEEDKKIANELAKAAGIDDIIKFGIDIKKAKGSIRGRPVESIIMADFKEFDFNGKKVGIGQTEIVDINEIYEIKAQISKFIENLKNKNYEMTVFVATDIIKEGSELFFSGDKSKIEKAFNIKVVGNSAYIPGLMSRKKQVVPNLQQTF
ncbi:Manganese-dependent inorganic pyrophosphatase [groundwater metagenome]|uniref:inorganic diphosphatase n=1 Tax=groundwater metagenome TaxID=717931 RepID=A0A098E7J5_9ZZZZ